MTTSDSSSQRRALLDLTQASGSPSNQHGHFVCGLTSLVLAWPRTRSWDVGFNVDDDGLHESMRDVDVGGIAVRSLLTHESVLRKCTLSQVSVKF
jgi:hypothetical protein